MRWQARIIYFWTIMWFEAVDFESLALQCYWFKIYLIKIKPGVPENAERVKCKNDQCKTVCKQGQVLTLKFFINGSWAEFGVIHIGSKVHLRTWKGHVPKSKSKVKCKKKNNGNYKWNNELSKCITCDPEKLKFVDESLGSTLRPAWIKSIKTGPGIPDWKNWTRVHCFVKY